MLTAAELRDALSWTGGEIPFDPTMPLAEAYYNGCDALVAART